MNPEPIQQILRDVFGDAAGALEIVAQTDRGPVWAFALRGSYEFAQSSWEPLRKAMTGLELWPLLGNALGRREDLWSPPQFHGGARDSGDPLALLSSDDLLREGLDLDVDEWLRLKDERAAYWRAEHQAWLESQGYASQEESSAAQTAIESRNQAIIAKMCADGEADEDGWVSFIDETGAHVDALCGERGDDFRSNSETDAPALHPSQMWRPPASIWLLLVPARHGWEVPATLRFGSWNGCPAPQEHVALMRHWHQGYGAQLVGLTHDTLSFSVARPPQNQEEALPLAHQHFHFCSGEGWNEDDTPEMLVDGLVNRRGWWFWWD
jgi:hypothetical protein